MIGFNFIFIVDDREEFQQINVSKKEVSDLLSDWYSCIDVNFLDLNDFDPITLDPNVSKQPSNVQVENLSGTLITPVKQIDEPLSTPETDDIRSQTQMLTHKQTQSLSEETIQSPLSSKLNYFDPCAISTPSKPNFNNNFISPNEQLQQQSFNSFNSSLLSVNGSLAHDTYCKNVHTSLHDNSPVFVPVMTFTTNSNASVNNVSLPYNSILITIPSEATATTSAMPSTLISSIQTHGFGNKIKPQSETTPSSKKPGCRSKISRFKNAAFAELGNFDLNSIESQVN